MVQRPLTIRQEDSPEAEALFLSIGEGAIVTDADARISRVNQVALNILRATESELIGKWFPEALAAENEHGKPIPNIERPITQAFVAGESITARQYYIRSDGSRVPVFLTVSPVFVGPRPVGAIEVFRDSTRELALERAKDEFVAIASHQLRTPATAVKQYISLLLDGYADPLTESQRLFAERAYESNERQLNIVQEILKITQLDLEKVILKPAKSDIGTVIEESIATVRSNFDNKNQKIIYKKPAKPIVANVDPDQIRIALENLLENASNYSWPGTSVTISAKALNGTISIAVKDEGVGIEAEDLSKLFQKFSRIPNPLSVEVGGTGLGLYWAAKIAELHDGKIQVSSRPDKGSTFTITLPDK
jgi:two-component system phosphate regulon sensor histidine kinase PhoR